MSVRQVHDVRLRQRFAGALAALRARGEEITAVNLTRETGVSKWTVYRLMDELGMERQHTNEPAGTLRMPRGELERRIAAASEARRRGISVELALALLDRKMTARTRRKPPHFSEGG